MEKIPEKKLVQHPPTFTPYDRSLVHYLHTLKVELHQFTLLQPVRYYDRVVTFYEGAYN